MKAIITLPVLIISLIAIAAIIGLAASVLFKNKPSINVMLIGIAVILVGGIFAVDPDANLGGMEYWLVYLGLALTIGGFAKKESNN